MTFPPPQSVSEGVGGGGRRLEARGRKERRGRGLVRETGRGRGKMVVNREVGTGGKRMGRWRMKRE